MAFRSPHPDVRIPDLTLTDFVLRGADHYLERPAFVDGLSGRSLSFGELRDRIRGVAAGLARRVGKGDVVAIWARRQHSEVRVREDPQARARGPGTGIPTARADASIARFSVESQEPLTIR